jgi:hypothetical protein
VALGIQDAMLDTYVCICGLRYPGCNAGYLRMYLWP